MFLKSKIVALFIIFLITRLLADGVRFLLTAIVIQQILGISIELCIIIIGIATLFYSILGGVKTIINIDAIQFFIYIFGGIFSIFYILYYLDFNFLNSLGTFLNQDLIKLTTDGSSFLFDSYFFVNALIGGVLLSFCSHGVDYMMVQRAMCTKNLGAAQKSIIGSGFLVFIQFIIFLFIGYLLAEYYSLKDVSFQKDREFAHFIINDLPIGIKGLLVAGVLSAAMSTLSSSINSLSSSSIIDFKIDFGGRTKFIIGFFWSILLVGVALFFDESNEALIITGIKIASFTYGILLSFFILTKFNIKFSKQSIMIGSFFGFVSVFIASSNNVAWTLLILICSTVNITLTLLAHILETKISKQAEIITDMSNTLNDIMKELSYVRQINKTYRETKLNTVAHQV